MRIILAIAALFFSVGSYAQTPPAITPPATGAEKITCVQSGNPKTCTSAQIAALYNNAINVMAAPYSALCNSNGTTGNGHDDTSGIQAAITAAEVRGVAIEIPAGAPGMCRTTAPLTAPTGITILGQGFQAPQNGSGGPPSVPSRGSWFFFDHTGYGIYLRNDASPTTTYAFSYLHNFGTYRDQPTVGGGWAPTVSSADILVESRVTIDNVMLLNPYTGIRVKGVGVLNANNVFGQPLHTGIWIENSNDIENISNVEFWPFWSQDASVYAYTIPNATGILIYRADGINITNFFTYAYSWSIAAVDQSGAGSGIAGFTFSHIYGDKADGIIRIASNYYSAYGSMDGVLANSDSAVSGTNAAIDISGTVASRISILGLTVTRANSNALKVSGSAHTVNAQPYKIQDWDRIVGGNYAFSAENGATINLLSIPTYTGGTLFYNEGSTGIIQLPTISRPTKPTVLANGLYSYSVTIANDSVFVFPLAGANHAATIILTPASVPAAGIGAGSYWLRSNASPAATTVSQAATSSLIDLGTGVLTGTTGTAGHLTIHAANDNNAYIENRFGTSVGYTITVMGN